MANEAPRQAERIWISNRAFVHICVPSYSKESEGAWYVREDADLATAPVDEARLRNQAQNLIYKVFGNVGNSDLLNELEALITKALQVAHASTLPLVDDERIQQIRERLRGYLERGNRSPALTEEFVKDVGYLLSRIQHDDEDKNSVGEVKNSRNVSG